MEPFQQLSKVEKKTLVGILGYLEKRKSSLDVQLFILSSPFLCILLVLFGKNLRCSWKRSFLKLGRNGKQLVILEAWE